MIYFIYYILFGMLFLITLDEIDEVKEKVCYMGIYWNYTNDLTKKEMTLKNIMTIFLWPAYFILLPLSGYKFRNWY